MNANDIAKVREHARDVNIANKIIDSLKNLQQNYDEKSRSRWIWELIQNAKDVVNSSGCVDITISFDEKNGQLRFSHNGKPFTLQNIVFLIEQVSTKDREEEEESKKNTGKFGTGFMTTHLLSEKVIVSGVLQKENHELKKIELEIDRSEKTREGIISANNRSFEQLEYCSNNGEDISDYREELFNTTFIYNTSQKGKEIAKEGLNSLKIAIPYVFMFVPEIRSISIEEYSCIYKRGKIYPTQDSSIKVQEVLKKENQIENSIYIASIYESNVSVAIEVGRSGNCIEIKKFKECLPKLFCDFPLIGTEDFPFPAVINSSCFNPIEPRSGIFLKDEDGIETNENKKLITEAVELYKKFMIYISNHGWNNIYNLVRLETQKEKTWASKEWIEENVVLKCKDIIFTVPIIENEDGKKVTLLDHYNQPNIWIINNVNVDIREKIWKLASELMPTKIINHAEFDEWYFALWKDCNKFTWKDLVSIVQKFANIYILEEKLNSNASTWLNRLYDLIGTTRTRIECIKNEAISIFPNQKGDFCKLNSLSIDINIDEKYKDILSYIQPDCRNDLLYQEIEVKNWMNLPECSVKDVFSRITNGLLHMPEQKETIYSQIVVLYEKGDRANTLEKKQNECLEFANTIFLDKYTKHFTVSVISEELLEDSIKYLCTKMVDEISSYKNLANLDSKFDFNEEGVKTWIARFIDFLKRSGYSFFLDRVEKTILPNQNGVFKPKEELFADNGDMDEILKDISTISGYNIKEELLLSEVFLPFPDNRSKGIADIAPQIISYVKNNQGLIKTQSAEVMDIFKKLYCWIKDNQDVAKKYFKDISDNIHWLYNDEEIAINMKKAEQIDAILEKCHIKDVNLLEKAFLEMKSKEEKTIINTCIEEQEEDLLIQYGIASEEAYKKALDMKTFKENFFYISSHDPSKFEYVNGILERAKNNIIDFLKRKPEYDLSNIIEIDKTIFIIEKNEEQIYLIARPSDYDYVAIYYDSEKNILDYNKDWELWVEDGRREPEKITFGKMLKLTGINKIPLKRVYE